MGNSKKITYLSTFYPYRGGIAQFNALLYRELEKQHEVEAVTFTRQYPNVLFPGKTQLVTPEDTADPIPSLRWLDSINPFSYWICARKIRRKNPDVVLTKYWMTFFGPSLGFVLGRQRKTTKRIAILDNVIPHERRFFDHWFNAYFIHRNDAFIAMTQKVKNDLLTYRPDAKCLIIPHPVYNHFGDKIPKNVSLDQLNLGHLADKNILLFFGIIRDYKGLDILLEVLSQLDDSFHLILAGESYGDFNKYEQQIDSLNIRDRCHLFQRYISDSEVATFFGAADVCMLTYKSATQSGITGIAQHFELPIIATPVGGLAETIIHGETGLICDDLQISNIVSTVNTYFKEQGATRFRKAIALQNQQNSWPEFSRRLLEFIDELA